ncbi:unnamed protein product [Gemmata massiliana]|uniref:Uncharacterized protein n=1 Tax=Gemmata massiliana TaxID=1210884 RepID=A0A6P2D952_9BACT|nr:unnamed protein product [Gemmata massiliana]
MTGYGRDEMRTIAKPGANASRYCHFRVTKTKLNLLLDSDPRDLRLSAVLLFVFCLLLFAFCFLLFVLCLLTFGFQSHFRFGLGE